MKDRKALHRALDAVMDRKAAKDAMPPPEYKKCKRCGKETDVLEIFPGGVCLGCWEKKEGRAPLTESDFKGMVNTFKNPLKKRGKDSNEEANARHALYNGERAAQRQDYRAAVVWFKKAEELFKDAGLTKEANRAAARAMECEDLRGKSDVDKGSKK